MIPEETNPDFESQLNSFEARLGQRIPDDYREFIKSGNEARHIGRKFRIPECKSEALVGNLLGFNVEYGLVQWLNEIGDELPDTHFPIGFDPGGNAIIMNAVTGQIWYWDSARHFSESSDEENAYEIADSFTDFIVGLYD